MTEFGLMAVDWEERINFERLRRYRVQRAKEALDNSEADVLFILRMEDVRYVTGFRHHLGPVTRFASEMAVLPKGGDPILYVMDDDWAKERMPWLPEGRVRASANFREFLGLKEWAADVQRVIGDLSGKVIGVDMLTVTMLQQLREVFPHSELADGWNILSKAKVIKSEDEIECIKAATMITEAGMEAAVAALKPGVRECEVLAEAWRVFTRLGSEWTQCSNIVCSGPYTVPYRRFTSDRIIRLGDEVIIDIGAGYNGYWGDFTRTFICGDIDATPQQKEIFQQQYDALFAACAAAKPGNTNADVYAAAEPYLQGCSVHVMGHGAGVNPWEMPYLTSTSKNSPMTLEPGMILNIEPYAGVRSVGVGRNENNVVVREDGPEVFTSFPFDERLVINVHPLDKTTGRSRRFTR